MAESLCLIAAKKHTSLQHEVCISHPTNFSMHFFQEKSTNFFVILRVTSCTKNQPIVSFLQIPTVFISPVQRGLIRFFFTMLTRKIFSLSIFSVNPFMQGIIRSCINAAWEFSCRSLLLFSAKTAPQPVFIKYFSRAALFFRHHIPHTVARRPCLSNCFPQPSALDNPPISCYAVFIEDSLT